MVVAISILSFISLFTIQAIQRALKNKSKIQKDIDKTSTLRDALRVMERDINMAFNYHDVYIELYNMAQKQRQKDAATPQPGATNPATPAAAGTPLTPGVNPNQPALPNDPSRFQQKVEKVYTQFIGESQSLTLTTLSNVRMTEEQKICSQAEVGYSLKPCRRRSNQASSSQCLWRRVANYIHDDITRDDGQSTVLLENVTDFKLRYLGPGREEEWVDTWITNERGDDQTKNKFPYAVEITLEVQDTSNSAVKDKKLRMTTVAAIRNPNNPPNPQDPKDPNGQQTDPNAVQTQEIPASSAPGTNSLTVPQQQAAPAVNH